MKSLLYLIHRLPYPPNKGDKITSFNMLKYLSKRFNIYLACFIDDKDDWQYVETVNAYCKETCIVGLNPKISKILSLRGIVTQEALSIPYYRNQKMQSWVDASIENYAIDSVLIFSGVMAQYVSQKLPSTTKTVLDLEDVDSDKWLLYSKDRTWPMNWIYKREAKYLLAYEKSMAIEFDTTVLVSKEEADFFKTLIPEVSDKVIHRTQGVDSQFFDPSLEHENLYQQDDKVFVFIGAMDYWPNIDAAIWFGKTVFPNIHKKHPQVRFYVVGMNPSEKVKNLNNIEGITVTGSVDDIRPYLAHAIAAILPLRVARGIQNKVLEAMAMEIPVIATNNALQGIKPCPGFKPIQADDEDALFSAVEHILETNVSKDHTGRSCILENYNWDTNLKKIENLL